MKPFKNLLIVESPNDAAFIQLLLDDLGIGVETDMVFIENLHKIIDLEGKEARGKTALSVKLKDINANLETYPNLEKLGIILDFDAPPNWDKDKNLQLINTAIANAFGYQNAIPIESEFVTVNTNSPGTDYERQFQTTCFFNRDSSGNGNLDTLLLEIRKVSDEKVPYADCLELWRDCVNNSASTLKVTENNYAKIWLVYLLRAKAAELGKEGKSILSDFEEKQSEVITKVGSSVFNLEHAALIPLRDFLLLFKNTPTSP